jgi:tetratricopeptide (TPR) repeat protein
MGEMAIAVANVEKALAQRPEDPAILNTSGLICHAIGVWDQALKYYYQALQIQPGSPEVMGNLQALVRDLLPVYAQYAQWHYLAGSFDRVAELELVSGNLLREIGDWAGAELHYRRGLAVRPVMWGVTAPEAIVQADRAGQPMPPPAAQTTCALGREADLRTIASAPPFAQLMERLAAIHFDRATIEASEADQAIALDLITEALAIQPAFPEALKLYGNLLLAKGDHQGAAEAYQKAVQFNPNYAEAWCNLGSLSSERFKPTRTWPKPIGVWAVPLPM